MILQSVTFFMEAPWLVFPEAEKRNRIIPVGASRTAAQNTAECHERAGNRTMKLQGIKSIKRTGRNMTA